MLALVIDLHTQTDQHTYRHQTNRNHQHQPHSLFLVSTGDAFLPWSDSVSLSRPRGLGDRAADRPVPYGVSPREDADDAGVVPREKAGGFLFSWFGWSKSCRRRCNCASSCLLWSSRTCILASSLPLCWRSSLASVSSSASRALGPGDESPSDGCSSSRIAFSRSYSSWRFLGTRNKIVGVL